MCIYHLMSLNDSDANSAESSQDNGGQVVGFQGGKQQNRGLPTSSSFAAFFAELEAGNGSCC